MTARVTAAAVRIGEFHSQTLGLEDRLNCLEHVPRGALNSVVCPGLEHSGVSRFSDSGSCLTACIKTQCAATNLIPKNDYVTGDNALTGMFRV